jgi:hypothetical protein
MCTCQGSHSRADRREYLDVYSSLRRNDGEGEVYDFTDEE